MKLALSTEQYKELEAKLNLTGDEDFAVTVQRRHNIITRGVHVFSRQPTTPEIVQYESTASRVEYGRGGKAKLEGSVLLAAEKLYNRLIARACDIVVGRHEYDALTAEQAREVVPALQKREAIREFLGNVSGLTSATEGEEDETGGSVVPDEA